MIDPIRVSYWRIFPPFPCLIELLGHQVCTRSQRLLWVRCVVTLRSFEPPSTGRRLGAALRLDPFPLLSYELYVPPDPSTTMIPILAVTHNHNRAPRSGGVSLLGVQVKTVFLLPIAAFSANIDHRKHHSPRVLVSAYGGLTVH